MTDHNATWSEEMYYNSNELDGEDSDPDPLGHTDSKSGYWDYRDE